MYIDVFAETEVIWTPPGRAFNLKPGLANGVSINYAYTTPKNSFRANAVGKLTRIENADRSGTLTVTFETQNKIFDEIMAVMELNLTGMFSVYAASSKRKWMFSNATIVTDPDGSFGTEAPTFQIMWAWESLKFLPNLGSAQNIVGS